MKTLSKELTKYLLDVLLDLAKDEYKQARIWSDVGRLEESKHHSIRALKACDAAKMLHKCTVKNADDE